MNAWMPLMLGDVLKDFFGLGEAERGRLISWWIHQWMNGALPNDMQQLARISGYSGDVGMLGAFLEHHFEQKPDGTWINERDMKERARVDAISLNNKMKAQKAANARWRKHRENMLQALPQAMQEHGEHASPAAHSEPASISLESVPTANESRVSGVDRANIQDGRKDGENMLQALPEAMLGGMPFHSKYTPSLRSGGSRTRASRPPLKRGLPAVGTGGMSETGIKAHVNIAAPDAAPSNVMTLALSKRHKWLRDQVVQFWAGVNHVDVESVPLGDRDDEAIRSMLEASPGLSEQKIIRCLEHRSIAVELGYFPASLQPSKWVKDLPSFLSGPINKFGDLIRKRNGDYMPAKSER